MIEFERDGKKSLKGVFQSLTGMGENRYYIKNKWSHCIDKNDEREFNSQLIKFEWYRNTSNQVF